MREFFITLLCGSVAGGMATALAGKRYEKHLRYLAALLCTVLVASPLLSFGADIELKLPEQENYSTDPTAAERLVLAQTKKDSEVALSKYIFEKTGIKPKSISIDIESVEGSLYIKKVSAVAQDPGDAETIRHCLKALAEDGTEVEVRE